MRNYNENKLRGKIKEICKKRDVDIYYTNLPDEIYSLYMENKSVKLIMISENIRDTDLEIKDIALGLGYEQALRELSIKVNLFNEKDKENANTVNKIANIYRDNLLKELVVNDLKEISKVGA